MGQKSSKKVDLYVTDDITHCQLPEEKVKTYIGRPREYTAIDVIVESGNTTEHDQSPKKKHSSSPRNPHSIITVLSKAHRTSYNLAFVIPKVKGSKPSTLARNSFIEEETNGQPKENDATAADKLKELSHTIFLLRPKVKSRLKKEFSLKRMEATKTFMNVMLDIQHKWGFSVKEFSEDVASISTGKYIEKLQDMISSESAKGGRLLSVMRAEPEKIHDNGTTNGSLDQKDDQETADEKTPKQLTLRMVFLHKYGEDVSPSFSYTVTCHQTKCTEQTLSLKKKQPTPKSSRHTNITWTEDWLAMFKDDSRLTEVIYVGEQSPSNTEAIPTTKSKKSKPRIFEVCTLCFYEKPIKKEKKMNGSEEQKDEDDGEDDGIIYPEAYDGLIREVWAPIDDNIQASLESEASTYGEFGWELCTVLVTSHVRMKSDGSEFRKCAIFFQRPKAEFVPEREMDKSRENLLQDSNVLVEGASEHQTEYLDDGTLPPSSPKEKVERFGVPILKVGDLDLSKLKSTSKVPPQPQKKDEEASALPAVQLKKVDREKLRKPEVSEENTAAHQVKLRPTDTREKAEKKDAGKEVPWMSTLEKKRDAVMKREKTSQPQNRPKSGEAEGEIAQKIDEMKEKRAERQNRVSIHKEENAEKDNIKEVEKATTEDIMDQTDESEGPVVSEAVEDSSKETEDKNVAEEPLTEDKEAEKDTGSMGKSSTKSDAEDVEVDAGDNGSISINAPEDAPSSQFMDLPLPPPVVTPQRGDETAISHLHLPSPPPVTDDLSPRSEEEFPYPPKESSESQEVETESPKKKDGATQEEPVAVDKVVSKDSQSEERLDFPIPPPIVLASPPISHPEQSDTGAETAIEDDVNENDVSKSFESQSPDDITVLNLESKTTEEEQVDESEDRAKEDQISPEADSTLVTTDVASIEAELDDDLPSALQEDVVEDKGEVSLAEETVNSKLSADVPPAQLEEEEKHAESNESISEVIAQPDSIDTKAIVEDTERVEGNKIPEEDTSENSIPTSEGTVEKVPVTEDVSTKNVDKTPTPPPSPSSVEENGNEEEVLDSDTGGNHVDLNNADSAVAEDIKEPQENDEEAQDNLKEIEKSESEEKDDSRAKEEHAVEANETESPPKMDETSAQPASSDVAPDENKAD